MRRHRPARSQAHPHPTLYPPHKRHADPDVFSLDVDGTDYYLAQSLFARGLRPKICVVEYNSALGPHQRITVPYDGTPLQLSDEARKLYYGCSVSGWQAVFSSWGYRFVTVDTNGVNAFFIDPAQVSTQQLRGCNGLAFAENYAQLREYSSGWQGQWEKIRQLPFVPIETKTSEA